VHGNYSLAILNDRQQCQLTESTVHDTTLREPVTDDQVDKAAKQTSAGPGAIAEGSRSDAIPHEFGGGDEALLFGGELAALDRVP
jgi:hypothetical protein